MATAHRHTSGGLNSSSGGELKLYLKGKRNTPRHTNPSDIYPSWTYPPRENITFPQLRLRAVLKKNVRWAEVI